MAICEQFDSHFSLFVPITSVIDSLHLIDINHLLALFLSLQAMRFRKFTDCVLDVAPLWHMCTSAYLSSL